MLITALNYFAFLKIQKWCHATLATYYANFVLLGKAELWGVDVAGEIVAFALTSQGSDFVSLNYLEIHPDYRRQGHAISLLHYLKEHYGKNLRLTTLPTHPSYPALKGLITAHSYTKLERSTLFTFAINEESMAKAGEPLAKATNRILQQGRQCLSFRSLTPEQLLLLRRSEGHTLNPSEFLDNKMKGLDWELSYALLKDGVLEAYTLISRLRPNQIVYELFSTLESKKYSGLIIAPLYCSYKAIKRDFYPIINKVTFVVYDTNTDAQRTFRHMLKNVSYTTKVNEAYFL